MPYTTLTSGLTLKIPTTGTKNWGDTFLSDFAQKISEHDHTGAGKGIQIAAGALAAGSVNESAFRLSNNAYLQGRNAADSGNIDAIKISASDKILFNVANVDNATRTSLGLAIGTNVQAYNSELTTIAARTSAGLASTGANSDITSLTAATAMSALTSISTTALTVTTSNGGNQEVLFNNGRVTARNTGATGVSTVAAWASDYTTNYGEVSLNRYNVSHASGAGRGELYFQNCTTRKIRWNANDGLVFENTDGDLWNLDVDLTPSNNLASDVGSAAKKIDNGYIDKVYCNKLYFDSPNDYTLNETVGTRTLNDDGDLTNVRSVLRQVVADLITRGIFT